MSTFGKLGVQQGLFLKVRAEHRFGSSIAPATVSILPPTLATELPVRDSDDLYLTNVLFTQMFSEKFGVYAGKLDTLDGDQNAYASGRASRSFRTRHLSRHLWLCERSLIRHSDAEWWF